MYMDLTEEEVQRMIRTAYNEGYIEGLADSVAEAYKDDFSGLYNMLKELHGMIYEIKPSCSVESIMVRR